MRFNLGGRMWFFGKIFFLCMALASLVHGEEFYFNVPKDAKDEELKMAANGIAARCKFYGYAGIKANVIERNGIKIISLSAESGFSQEMKDKLVILGRCAAQKIELGFCYEMTEREKEQFKPGHWDNPQEDKAPKGTRWVRMLKEDTLEDDTQQGIGPVVLLRNEIISQSEFQRRHPSSRSVWLLTKAATQKASKFSKLDGIYGGSYYDILPGKGNSQAKVDSFFLIDGKAVRGAKVITAKCEYNQFLFKITATNWLSEAYIFSDGNHRDLFETVLQNPLPFALAK